MHMYNYMDVSIPSHYAICIYKKYRCLYPNKGIYWALCFKCLKTVIRDLAYLKELSLSKTRPLFTLCMYHLNIFQHYF